VLGDEKDEKEIATFPPMDIQLVAISVIFKETMQTFCYF